MNAKKHHKYPHSNIYIQFKILAHMEQVSNFSLLLKSYKYVHIHACTNTHTVYLKRPRSTVKIFPNKNTFTYATVLLSAVHIPAHDTYISSSCRYTDNRNKTTKIWHTGTCSFTKQTYTLQIDFANEMNCSCLCVLVPYVRTWEHVFVTFAYSIVFVMEKTFCLYAYTKWFELSSAK